MLFFWESEEKIAIFQNESDFTTLQDKVKVSTVITQSYQKHCDITVMLKYYKNYSKIYFFYLKLFWRKGE